MENVILFPIDPKEFICQVKQVIEEALKKQDIKKNPLYPPDGLTFKPLLTIQEVCSLFDISKPTVYEWKAKGILKPKQIHGRVYFLYSDILELINKK